MENSQKVRHIPIFVEGRDEPIINRDHNTQQNNSNANSNASAQNSSNSTSSSAFASAESSAGPFQSSHQNPYFQNQNHNFGRPPMNFSDMDDMGFSEMNMPHGSIFERTKDFPVRTDFPDFFSNVRSASPSNRRSESPIHSQQPRKSPSGGANPNVHNLRQSGSSERPIPVQHDNVKRSSTPQRQQTPPKQPPPPQQPVPEQQQVPIIPQEQPQPTEEQRAAAAKQKALEDSITKIQKIQQSVLELMGRVEQYNGADRKEYLFLDEMLTQNLLKLDDIDAEGKDNIKNARREAIKCINSLISLLEAKNEEATQANNNSNNNGVEKSKSNENATQQEASVDQNNMEQTQPTLELNGTSKNSSYDNVNQVQQQTSSDVPEKSAEASLEEKIAGAMNKQDNGQKQT
ncbi:BAG domain-containing protein Samui [Chironomus tepperi]|uniref:BAG domain-containing protein Samui n=1 Tax=Chironomus tepperi TaxID=113505 RepID=UPI00391F8A1B